MVRKESTDADSESYERTIEHAGNQLREKAGEISSVFASELDHSSRSFVGHSQTQMEEVVRDSFERARALFAEAADTTAAAFTDEVQRAGRHELDGFSEEFGVPPIALASTWTQRARSGRIRRLPNNRLSCAVSILPWVERSKQGG